MITGAVGTLFSGGEGFGIGAREAGLDLLWGVEGDKDIAEVANDNLGGHVIVADLLDGLPSGLQAPEYLHASPPCPNFSVANSAAKESKWDIHLASTVATAISRFLPRVFTLENVMQYWRSDSWQIILKALFQNDYWFQTDMINAADFGVPQSRRRMWVRAIHKRFSPGLPAAEPWQGWYDAVEDLIHTMPDTMFAEWQHDRLPPEISVDTRLFSQGISRDRKGGEYGIISRGGSEPAFTITSSSNMNGIRAVIVDGAHGKKAHMGPHCRARLDDEPMFSIMASQHKSAVRAILQNGRIVRITPRALARFQTFPDWYELPANKGLMARVVGNAVPPLLAEKLLRQLMETV